ncbi:MAG: 50S rRNA methyltransferase [Ardenticatenaceae bacterium]|nr:50S rRNA methyltransferase [Ardenticatenaceae bacterium]MCB9445809.1 50S rRNA methyltransferase [Ardenticatenaceae bacterium]
MLILTAVPDFIDFARDELRRAAFDAQILAELEPGVLLAGGDFFPLAQQWQTQPPIFARHICPVQETVPVAGTNSDLARLTQCITRQFLDLIEPEWPFSVQARIFANAVYKPFDINSALADVIQSRTGAPLDVRQPVQILSVVISSQTAYLGLSLAEQNLSDWAGGVRRFAREPEQISRAEFKLLEALEQFKINLPPRGTALDLGAAPGGWTRVLRQKEQYVTAVDPAQLHSTLQADKSVRHLQMTAEEYLTQYPDTFDLIVNDMRLDARDSSRLMVEYAPYLYPHGLVIMTLKLPKEKRRTAIDHSFNILKQAYNLQNARQLFHNRSEITIHLTKTENFS